MTRKLWTRLLPVMSATVLASAASAHPGHGLGGGSFSVAHYLSEPAHLVGVPILLASVAAVCWLLRRRRA